MILSFSTSIWWSAYYLKALAILVIDVFSVISLLVCRHFVKKYTTVTNTPIKLTIIFMGVVYFDNLALAIWISIDFSTSAAAIANLTTLWISVFIMTVSYLCFLLPLGIVFWNVREEDIQKAQNIGGKFVAPEPIPLSSRNDRDVIITLK